MPASVRFKGNALALSADGLAGVAKNVGVFAPELWTVLTVETSGCGFLPDRRSQILYECHIFHRLTDGRYDDGNISDPTPGGYGPTGAHQYDRLTMAITKDRSCALQSVSWGIGQIMGENYSLAGFHAVEEMVAAMSDSEDQQLAAMGNFLVSSRLSASLRAHDWTSFARGYNRPNYLINRYDVRLNGEFQKNSAGTPPDLNVRAAQLYLIYLGFHLGPVDGIAGVRTLSALAQFESQLGVQIKSVIDASAVAELAAALTPTSAVLGAASG